MDNEEQKQIVMDVVEQFLGGKQQANLALEDFKEHAPEVTPDTPIPQDSSYYWSSFLMFASGIYSAMNPDSNYNRQYSQETPATPLTQ